MRTSWPRYATDIACRSPKTRVIDRVHSQDFIIGNELDARLQALQELLGIDRSRALREAINSDKRNDHSKLAKLAVSYRQLKSENSATESSRFAEIEALRSTIAALEDEIQSSSAYISFLCAGLMRSQIIQLQMSG